MKKKIWIILGVVLALVVVGVVALPRLLTNLNPAGQSAFTTEPARLDNLTVFVGATGSVRANQSGTVVWQTGGRVGTVLVEKGQIVQAEALLADLDPASISQNLIQTEAELINARRDLEKLMTNSETRANAHLALIQAQQALADAEKESRSKLYQRASQETIDIARANLITANEALDSAEAVFTQYSGLNQDSPVYAAALTQYARARQTQQAAEYNLLYVQGLPDPLTVEEVYARLEQAQARLLTAKQEWERVKDGPDPDDIRAAEIRVAAAQSALDLLHLKAPFTGTVTAVDSKPGDPVNAGTIAFTLHDLSRLFIDLQVSEVDINSVKIGQPVNLSFDGIPGVDFTGIVSDITTVGSSSGGAVNFGVTVEISDPDPSILPGMTGAANIAVSQLESVLVVPSRAVRTVNNERVVYVLRNNIPVMIPIKLGVSANNLSQILSGDVKEGDLTILNPPANPMMMVGGGPEGGPR